MVILSLNQVLGSTLAIVFALGLALLLKGLMKLVEMRNKGSDTPKGE